MNKPKSKTQPAGTFTDYLTVQFGEFNVSKHRVPYMTSNLTFRQVAEWLSLVTDDPKYARQDWNLDELFQRDIDYARVKKMVNQYLNPSIERWQFFNSITVVLIPDDEKKDKFIAPTITDKAYEEHQLSIGPILITAERENHEITTFGTLCWNRDQVAAVAIDGQHRLAAIKQFVDLHKKDKSSESSVSVIFIVIDEKLGFSNLTKDDRLKVMRSLFIDLNKHAVPVSRIRNLLLDDNDPLSRCVRGLISPQLQYASADRKDAPLGIKVGQHGEFDARLPLVMVDWHGDSKSKIDTGPYIASLLSLDWTVQALLETKGVLRRKIVPSSINPDEEDPYKNYVNQLGSWNVWNDPNLALKARLKEAEAGQRGFNLTAEDAEALSLEFQQLWGRPITRLLTSLPGYNDVLKIRIAKKSLCPQFSQWYQAKSLVDSNKSSSVKQLHQERFQRVLEELQAHGINLSDYEECLSAIEEIKKDKILFFLVGQRAIIRCMAELAGMQELNQWIGILKWKIADFKDCHQDFYAKFLSDAMSGICASDLGIKLLTRNCAIQKTQRNKKIKNYSQYFWAGSLTSRDPAEPNMDYSKVAMERGTIVMLLICFCYWFVKTNVATVTKDSMLKLVDEVLDQKYQVGQLGFEKQLVDAIGRFSGVNCQNGDSLPMRFLSNYLEDPTDTETKLLARERIALIVDAAFMK